MTNRMKHPPLWREPERLPRPLPPEVRARWDALPEWLREDAPRIHHVRLCLHKHVVRGEPLHWGALLYAYAPHVAVPHDEAEAHAAVEALSALMRKHRPENF